MLKGVSGRFELDRKFCLFLKKKQTNKQTNKNTMSCSTVACISATSVGSIPWDRPSHKYFVKEQ